MQLSSTTRTKLGNAVNILRKQGVIPAELYGNGMKNIHLSVPSKEFKKVYKQAGESALIDLMVDQKPYKVMIYGIALHPVSDEITHIDFNAVRLDEKIKIRVPVEFTGEAPALKLGGTLVKAMQELEIEALPTDIPRSISVDLTSLDLIGKSIAVKDIILPKGVKTIADGNSVIVTITTPMSEEEEQKVAAIVDVTAIKSEIEEKKAERETKKAATEEAPATEKK